MARGFGHALSLGGPGVSMVLLVESVVASSDPSTRSAWGVGCVDVDVGVLRGVICAQHMEWGWACFSLYYARVWVPVSKSSSAGTPPLPWAV